MSGVATVEEIRDERSRTCTARPGDTARRRTSSSGALRSHLGGRPARLDGAARVAGLVLHLAYRRAHHAARPRDRAAVGLGGVRAQPRDPLVRWLAFTPALFAVALLDPEIFRSLISDGQGGGALIVVFTALAAGFALSRRRWPARLGSGLVALLGLLLLGAIGGMAGPLSSARGAWVSLYGFSFILLLCLASVLPYPPVRPPRGAWSFTAFGALCGSPGFPRCAASWPRSPEESSPRSNG